MYRWLPATAMPSRPCSEPVDTSPEMSSTVPATAPLRSTTTLPVFSATYRASPTGMAATGWSRVASLVSLALVAPLSGGAVAAVPAGRGATVVAGLAAVAPGAAEELGDNDEDDDDPAGADEDDEEED